MRTTYLLRILLILCISLSSCKKGEKPTAISAEKSAFSLQEATHNIQWIAYKTSEKVPVKGVFKKISITKNGEGNSLREAIHLSEFTIPVSSLFSADNSRDFKLKKFFFGMLENTTLLEGVLALETDSTGTASITMNALTQTFPFQYSITDKQFQLLGALNLHDWKVEKALDSLNSVCKEKHTGTDGIPKTWSTVDLQIQTVFK